MPHRTHNWTHNGFWRRFLSGTLLILLLQAGGAPKAAANPSVTSGAAAATSFFEDFSQNQKVRKHRFTDIPIKLRGQSAKVRLHPRTITITILGPAFDPAKKAALEKKIEAYIELASVSTGVSVKPAKIRLPRGYVLLDAKPEIFVVEIKSGG